MAEEIRIHITVITNKIFSVIKLLQNKIRRNCFPMFSLFYSMCSRMVAGKKEYRKPRQNESPSETASVEGWFCFRNWNVSRLDFYFQFTFQIQLPKLFDLSPCLLTRKRTLGLLSWELGAHVERLAPIHTLAKFSHTKGPAREKRKDESGGRQDFKGCAAAPGPAQAPPSADIRCASRARAAFLRGRSARVPGLRAGEGGPAAEEKGRRAGRGVRATSRQPEAGPHAKLRRLRKVFRKEEKAFHVQPTRRAVLLPANVFQLPHPFHSIPFHSGDPQT